MRRLVFGEVGVSVQQARGLTMDRAFLEDYWENRDTLEKAARKHVPSFVRRLPVLLHAVTTYGDDKRVMLSMEFATQLLIFASLGLSHLNAKDAEEEVEETSDD